MPREQPCTGELSLSLALLHSFTLTLNINLVLPRTQPRYVLLVGRMSCGGGAVINVGTLKTALTEQKEQFASKQEEIQQEVYKATITY